MTAETTAGCLIKLQYFCCCTAFFSYLKGRKNGVPVVEEFEQELACAVKTEAHQTKTC